MLYTVMEALKCLSYQMLLLAAGEKIIVNTVHDTMEITDGELCQNSVLWRAFERHGQLAEFLLRILFFISRKSPDYSLNCFEIHNVHTVYNKIHAEGPRLGIVRQSQGMCQMLTSRCCKCINTVKNISFYYIFNH
jgi:hypothetical protein